MVDRYMSGLLGGQGRGCLGGGGSIMAWNRRGQRRELRRSWTEMRRKARGRDWNRKRGRDGNEGGEY